MSDEPAATTPIPVTIIAFNLSSRFLLALAFVFIFSSRFPTAKRLAHASFYIGEARGLTIVTINAQLSN